VTRDTVAPLPDQVLENMDELFESGRKMLIYNPTTPQLAAAAGKSLTELHLYSILQLWGPDFQRVRLNASNLYKYCTIGSFNPRAYLLRNQATALNNFIALQSEDSPNILNIIQLSYPQLSCHIAKKLSSVPNKLFYHIWYHNTIRFDKTITHFHIGGFHLFQRRSIMSSSEKSLRTGVRQAQQNGQDVHAISETHVVRAINLESKILLPFVLLLGFIGTLAVPSFLFEIIIGNRRSQTIPDVHSAKLRNVNSVSDDILMNNMLGQNPPQK